MRLPNWSRTLPGLLLFSAVVLAELPEDDDAAPQSAFGAARDHVERGEYRRAATLLEALADAESSDADVWNLLGFSQRKLGMYEQALESYRRALDLDAEHLGALEYLGELYVETGEPARADELLDKLRRMCGEDCEEYRDLARSIDEAR